MGAQFVVFKVGSYIKALCFIFITYVLCSFPVLAINVIAHPQVSLKNMTLTTHQLRQIYTMRQRLWENGDTIVVFILPSKSELHQDFSKKVLKIFPYQLDRIWRKLTYSGLGNMPKIVTSIAELKQVVRSTPGAIGYVDNVNEGDDVNVIKIK